MKNLNPKLLLFLTVILTALSSYFIFQWSNEKAQSETLNSIQEKILFTNFTYLTKELYHVAETLDYYDEEFTEQEKELFLRALDISGMTLDETDESLSFLLNSNHPATQEYTKGILLYEHEVWKTQEILREISSGNINSENDIHLIGSVIKKQNDKLSDMFYGEKQIGREEFYKKEGLINAIGLVNMMNEEIEEIINK